MIITISGEAGSGKSTCAKALAKMFFLKHYSTGDLMRQIAVKYKISLEELSRKAEKDPEIDRELDERQSLLGKKEDNFIIDGRLSAYFIPHAIKIFLTADLSIRAMRIFNAKRDTECFDSIEMAISKIQKRQESEIKRYLSWYDFNPYEPSFYDIVFDTGEKSVEDLISALNQSVLRHIKE